MCFGSRIILRYIGFGTRNNGSSLCYASRCCDIPMMWVTIPLMEGQIKKTKGFVHCWVGCSDVYIKFI